MWPSRPRANCETGLLNYYTEYKRFPALTSSSSTDTQVDSYSDLIGALMSVPDEAVNIKMGRRGILFFSAKKAKSPTSAGLFGKDGRFVLNDPWGNPYQIVYDSNYDNQIDVPTRDGDGTEPLYATVAVWSWGPNGVPGKGDGRKNDDIHAF